MCLGKLGARIAHCRGGPDRFRASCQCRPDSKKAIVADEDVQLRRQPALNQDYRPGEQGEPNPQLHRKCIGRGPHRRLVALCMENAAGIELNRAPRFALVGLDPFFARAFGRGALARIGP